MGIFLILKQRKLTWSSAEWKDVSFRLLDLPIAIRRRIYRYAIGLRVVHIFSTCQKKSNRASSLPLTSSVCKSASTKQTLVEQWETGNTSVVPSCAYASEHSDVPRETLQLSLLRSSKCVFEEAGRILFGHNIFAFQDSGPFEVFLLKGPSAVFRKEKLTRLAIVITPKSRSTHFWNGVLGELYLPHGTMSSPEAHFPAIIALQLYLKNDASDGGCDRWTSPIWIWAFMYFALETLESVSVISKDYKVQDLAESSRGRLLNEEEQKGYEAMVQESLLREWMGGDQDDVELMHGSYYMKTRDCAWREEGDGALPWVERY